MAAWGSGIGGFAHGGGKYLGATKSTRGAAGAGIWAASSMGDADGGLRGLLGPRRASRSGKRGRQSSAGEPQIDEVAARDRCEIVAPTQDPKVGLGE